MIIGQDGKTVKFRMKCTTCGKEDSSWKSIPIPHGVARAGFYCTKCRKRTGRGDLRVPLSADRRAARVPASGRADAAAGTPVAARPDGLVNPRAPVV